MKKSMLALIMVCILILSLSACSATDAPSDEDKQYVKAAYAAMEIVVDTNRTKMYGDGVDEATYTPANDPYGLIAQGVDAVDGIISPELFNEIKVCRVEGEVKYTVTVAYNGWIYNPDGTDGEEYSKYEK